MLVEIKMRISVFRASKEFWDGLIGIKTPSTCIFFETSELILSVPFPHPFLIPRPQIN